MPISLPCPICGDPIELSEEMLEGVQFLTHLAEDDSEITIPCSNCEDQIDTRGYAEVPA